MARHKLLDENKKPKIGITINEDLDNMLNIYLNDNKLNRSRYIENLIREDMLKRGVDVKPDFEKK